MRRLLACLLLLLACGDDTHPPADAGPDTSPLDHWDVVFQNLADGALTCAVGFGSDLFVVGGRDLAASGGTILRYDGQAWSRMANPAPALLWWTFGFGPTDVWAVGQTGAILHYDGSAWTATPSGTDATLSGIWGADGGEIWAVGGTASAPFRPAILRWNGSVWSSVDPGTTDTGALFKVWGTDRSHVFAVGANGIVLGWDGARWTQAPRVTMAQLITVHGRGPSDVWAVGGTGNAAVLHYDGQSWTPLADTATLLPMLGVFADPDGTLITVGQQGFIAIRSGSAWHPLPTMPTTDCLHNVAPYAGGFVAVGGNLLSPASGLHGVLLRSGSALSTTLP